MKISVHPSTVFLFHNERNIAEHVIFSALKIEMHFKISSRILICHDITNSNS